MKFKKEITIVIEGELDDASMTPEDIFKSLRFSYLHWWERNPNWMYGQPVTSARRGKVEKITFDGVELK